jgi:hypothetical protein
LRVDWFCELIENAKQNPSLEKQLLPLLIIRSDWTLLLLL